MATAPKVIELMAGEVAEALKRQGIGADERVTLTILPAEELIPGRREFYAHGSWSPVSRMTTSTG